MALEPDHPETDPPEPYALRRLEVAPCPSNIRVYFSQPQVPAGETAVAAPLGSPCLRYGLCTAP